ncbi:MAG: hypothetical protein DHS20C18_19760 [Saprospiraceae bacterium]|nr:MAG: hypothetical protein DHS20C18_19760 [Saprospiraceae bacterium]
MTTAQDIGQVKKEIKLQFVENKPKTFKDLKTLILDSSPFYNQLLLIESQHNTADSQRLMNLITNEEMQVAYSLMTVAFLSLIDKMEISDFNPELVRPGPPGATKSDAEEPGPSQPEKKKEGFVGYRIPGRMQLNQNSRCTIRISWEELLLREHLKQDIDTKIEGIHVSNVMHVGLEDYTGDDAFQIRPINDTEQFIVEDEVTKWLFNVKPLLEGKHTLTLKVAVIEPINGKERKREIVLEETIEILSEEQAKITEDTAPKEVESEFKALMAFSFFPVGKLQGVLPKTEDKPKSVEKKKEGKGKSTTWVTAIIAILLFLFLIWNFNKEIGDFLIGLLDGVTQSEQISGNDVDNSANPEGTDSTGGVAPGDLTQPPGVDPGDPKKEKEGDQDTDPRKNSPDSKGDKTGKVTDNLQVKDPNKGNDPNTKLGQNGQPSGDNGNLSETDKDKIAREKEASDKEANDKVERAKAEREKAEMDKKAKIDYGSVRDKDRNKYRTLKLKDGNTWVVDNLKFEVEASSWCFKMDEKNCEKNGRLYNYEGAVLACEGLRNNWRLPTLEEWQNLINLYGITDSTTTVDFNLSFSALRSNGDSHFDATLSGYAIHSSTADPKFSSLNVEGYYWTSTGFKNSNAYGVYFNGIPNRNKVEVGTYIKSRGQTCRCIKD